MTIHLQRPLAAGQYGTWACHVRSNCNGNWRRQDARVLPDGIAGRDNDSRRQESLPPP
jgi:hypothetical protein